MEKRDIFMKRARERVKAALMSRDMLLSGVTKTMEDLDKVINLLGERLEEWYGIYFPEMKVEDKLKYAELSAQAARTLGAGLSDNDLAQCRFFANSIIGLHGMRERYLKYQGELAMEICPNMSKVAGPEVAAKLVSHVGSLARLARLPSSTIQVLGAEKALFKHLKNRRISPPKHGIIFQHPRISGSPKAVRGRIARALAAKICIAAKADAYTKRDIGAGLLADFDKRYAEIMAAYGAEKAKRPAASQ